MTSKKHIVGAFMAFGLKPEGIIAMDFSSLEQAQSYVDKLSNKPSHWNLMGMCDDELIVLYEEKDGAVLKNLFKQ